MPIRVSANKEIVDLRLFHFFRATCLLHFIVLHGYLNSAAVVGPSIFCPATGGCRKTHKRDVKMVSSRKKKRNTFSSFINAFENVALVRQYFLPLLLSISFNIIIQFGGTRNDRLTCSDEESDDESPAREREREISESANK